MATSPKKVTVSELKTFIDAVEFAADTDEWIPSKRQWLRIREMIDSLVPDAPPPAPPPQIMQLPIPQHLQQPQMPMQLAPGGLGNGGMMSPPQIPQGVPIAAGNPGQAVRTPDIDTSSGKYQSSFA
jgi:hypothetical protein